MSMTVKAMMVTEDGTAHFYTPSPGFIPQGTLATVVPEELHQEIDPNGAPLILRYQGGMKCRRLDENTWEYQGPLDLQAKRQGADGVWRPHGDPVTVTRVVRVTHSPLKKAARADGV